MTNERRYANALYLLEKWSEAAGLEDFAREVEKDPRKWTSCKTFPVAAAAAELMVDALDGMAAKRTGKTTAAAIKRVYENNGTMRPNLYGLFQSGEKWAVCDGYRAIRVNADIPELPHVAPEAVQLGRIFDGAEKGEALELPSVAELKAWAAAHGGKRALNHGSGEPYILAGLVGVNPYYLIDAIQALENVRAYIPENWHSPIYFEADNGDAILLPVRLRDNHPERAAILDRWAERKRRAA